MVSFSPTERGTILLPSRKYILRSSAVGEVWSTRSLTYCRAPSHFRLFVHNFSFISLTGEFIEVDRLQPVVDAWRSGRMHHGIGESSDLDL